MFYTIVLKKRIQYTLLRIFCFQRNLFIIINERYLDTTKKQILQNTFSRSKVTINAVRLIYINIIGDIQR